MEWITPIMEASIINYNNTTDNNICSKNNKKQDENSGMSFGKWMRKIEEYRPKEVEEN